MNKTNTNAAGINTIKLSLTDHATGTWTLESGEVMSVGIADRDPWTVAHALSREIAARLDNLNNVLVECYDPNGTDLMGSPIEGGALVCQLRIVDGVVTPQVPR